MAPVPRLLVVTVVGCGLVLAGCARSVAVDPPASPDPQVLAACTALHAALPAELSTVGERREVTPESPLTAAYGDPPVGVRCGVAEPVGLAADALLVTVDDVDWFAQELSNGWRLTTVERVAAVEITVDEVHGPAPSVAADLTPAISATIPPAR
ncbi:MAG: DUF3515 family protein [Candidatus Nanopelagicales bacterium]